jgi:NADPH2:quinone reductase
VSFTTYSGSWAEYAIPDMYFVIDDDVPLSSAASGIVNPLAALAMVSTIKTKNLGGAIHTAAASGLGKMLVRMCKTENLPLINIVRRK